MADFQYQKPSSPDFNTYRTLLIKQSLDYIVELLHTSVWKQCCIFNFPLTYQFILF